MAERVDDLNRDGLKIIQNTEYFRFGIDAVLLSGFARADRGEAVADIGTGTGVIPILMSAKTTAERFCGIEIQPALAEMAARSVALNGLSHRITIVPGDARDKSLLPAASFEVVTANPPYVAVGGGIRNGSEAFALSRQEISLNLDELAGAAARLLKFGGRFYLVHRPNRLTDVFVSLRSHGLEPKALRLVQPRADKAPNMALIEAVRGSGPQLNVLPALIVYDGDEYTGEVKNIYYG